MLKINKKKKYFKVAKGFTLVELLISITVFTFVGIVAIASLVATQQLNSSLKATRNLYDNMYFTMDEITRSLKEGRQFQYESPDKTSISFIPYNEAISSNLRIKYLLQNDTVYKSQEISTGNYSNNQALTNDKIKINKLQFELLGNDKIFDTNDNINNLQQPSVKIMMAGENKEKPSVKFNIENFATQRDTKQ
ncbi:MAG: hypothetical protein QG614_225 [Patescibacteria group bacterium]|nr:hypothetical protein [Patescibacteria group bacterium]